MTDVSLTAKYAEPRTLKDAFEDDFYIGVALSLNQIPRR